MGHQLYQLKTKFNAGTIEPGQGITQGSNFYQPGSDDDKIEKIQKDQMVQLLKRNHDTLMEKYELFR